MKEEIYIDTISGEKLIKEICYYENGNIKREYYFINGKLHRNDGPAEIWYYENGNIKEEHYYKNNKRHRENSPAIIYYDKDSNIEREYYYINDKEITDDLQIMVLKGLSNI